MTVLLGRNQLDTILPITHAIITSLDPEAVLQTLVQKVRELEAVKAASVYEYDERSQRLRIRSSAGLSKSYTRSMTVPIGVLAVGRAFQTGDVVVVGDVDSDPSYGPYLRRIHSEEFEAVLAAPLVARQRLLGVLVVYFQQPISPAEYDTGAIRTLANLAAVALDNARLFQEQMRAARELAALSKQLSEQREILSRALSIHEWLVHRVLADGGLDAVVSALADLAQATVVVEDVHLNPISVSCPEPGPAKSHGEPASLGLGAFAGDPRVRDHLARVRAQRRPHLLDAIPEIGLAAPRITAPVLVGGNLLALVSILASERDVGQLDYILAEQGAVAIALELMKGEVAFEAEQRIRGDFLQNLLMGRIESLDAHSAVVAASRFDLAALQRVVVIRPDRHMAEPSAERNDEGRISLHSQLYGVVERVVAASCPKSMVIATKGSFTVLLGSDVKLSDAAVRELGEQIVSHVATYPVPTTVSVGIGGPCQHLKDVRRSYNEATRALDVAALLRKQSLVVSFSDLGVFEILLRQGKPDELREFASRYIGPLAAYDRRQGGGLVDTLETYVRHNYSLHETAEELVLHPNTVKYRLQKIEELCGANLRSSEDLMNLQIALRLHRLML